MAAQLQLVQNNDDSVSQIDTLAPSATDGEPPDMDSMKERLIALEGRVEGLAKSQEHTFLAVLGVGAILAAFMIYGLNRLDVLSDRVSDIPSKVGVELKDTVKTLSEAITAAKQQAPQIIVMPAPPQFQSIPQQQAPIQNPK